MKRSGDEVTDFATGRDCEKSDAYAVLFRGPSQLASFEVCNPLDFKEPPVKLLWAHMNMAGTAVDLLFDVDTDRGETAGLTLGGAYSCDKLFLRESAVVLGEGCIGAFIDKRFVRLYLVVGEHNVTESSDGVSDGTTLSLRGGVVYHDRFRERGNSSTASVVVTRRAGEPIAVVADVTTSKGSYAFPSSSGNHSTIKYTGRFAGRYYSDRNPYDLPWTSPVIVNQQKLFNEQCYHPEKTAYDDKIVLHADRSTGAIGDVPLRFKWSLKPESVRRSVWTDPKCNPATTNYCPHVYIKPQTEQEKESVRKLEAFVSSQPRKHTLRIPREFFLADCPWAWEYIFNVVAYNKEGHDVDRGAVDPYTGQLVHDPHADTATATINIFPGGSCDERSVPSSPKLVFRYGPHNPHSIAIDSPPAIFTPASLRKSFTQLALVREWTYDRRWKYSDLPECNPPVSVTWAVKPEYNSEMYATFPKSRVAGWPTPTGLHPEVVAQEAKLQKIVAATRGMVSGRLSRTLFFAARQYHFTSNYSIFFNDTWHNDTVYDVHGFPGRVMRAGYAGIKSIIVGGMGGDPMTDYFKPIDANGGDFSYSPVTFDASSLYPSVSRANTGAFIVDKTEEVNVTTAPLRFVDPDWRTDTHALRHDWTCEDLLADRPTCHLRGMTKKLKDMYGIFVVDDIPSGSPLTLPPNTMGPNSAYTFTMLTSKTHRSSRGPDKVQLVTGNNTCPSANIEPTPKSINHQFLFRIYGDGVSALGRVQFRWSIVDTSPATATTLAVPVYTHWQDKGYMSIVKNTMNPGREYTLTLTTRVAGVDNGCEGQSERILVTNAPPRSVGEGVVVEPAIDGIEFETKFSVDCGEWVDADKTLEYRLAYWYDYDVFAPRWMWLTELQEGHAVFEDVLLPHNRRAGGRTKIRCVAFDDEGAFGTSVTTVKVAAHANISAAVDDVFVIGSHLEHLHVFPAALRRLQEVDKLRHAVAAQRRRRALLGENIEPSSPSPPSPSVGTELKKALDVVRGVLARCNGGISEDIIETVLELSDTYLTTSCEFASFDPGRASRDVPIQALLPVVTRVAHDWPVEQRKYAAAASRVNINASPESNAESDEDWARLASAYAAAARLVSHRSSGVDSVKMLRGAAAAAVANEETCDAPVTTRTIAMRGGGGGKRRTLYSRATFSGTVAAYNEKLSGGASESSSEWPSHIPTFSVSGAFRSTRDNEAGAAPTIIKSDECVTFSVGAIPSRAFETADVDVIIVSPVVAVIHVVDQFLGQLSDLNPHGVRDVVATARLAFHGGRFLRNEKVFVAKNATSIRSRMYCAHMRTTATDGSDVAVESPAFTGGVSVAAPACVLLDAVEGYDYDCVCDQVGAVALAVAGPFDESEWTVHECEGDQCATCFDGVRNGDEEGVDCGGAWCGTCSNAEQSRVLDAGPCANIRAGEDDERPTVSNPRSLVDSRRASLDEVDETSVTTTYVITGMSAAKADVQLNFVENVVKSRLSRGIKFHSIAPSRVSAEMSEDGTSATLVLKFIGFVGKDPRGVKRFSQMSAGPRTMRAVNVIMKKRGTLVVAANYKTDSVISWSDGHAKALKGRIGGLIRKAKSAAAAGNQAARAKFARGIGYFKALLNEPPRAVNETVSSSAASGRSNAATESREDHLFRLQYPSPPPHPPPLPPAAPPPAPPPPSPPPPPPARKFHNKAELIAAIKECRDECAAADINRWDVTAVTDMSNLFFINGNFNGDISGWDTSKVTRMRNMFYYAKAFNGDISKWDTSKVTNMQSMFYSASSFNGDISGWDVSKVTNMGEMFSNAEAFNGNISKWDVSKVTNMGEMFSKAKAFNGNISKWDVSKVTNMGEMFSKAKAFNGNISKWDVSKVTKMKSMFIGASSFNGDISKWDVSKVTNMGGMFLSAFAFNGDISKWDTSKVIQMGGMFYNAKAFNGDISKWDVSKVTDMSYLFHRIYPKVDISEWDVSSVTNMGYMFSSASFNGDISKWDVSKVTNMGGMFSSASSFNGDISKWDTSKVTNMQSMFFNAKAFNGDISKWDTSKVTNMQRMFYSASSFNGDISNWDVSKVTNMERMFFNAKAFNGDISKWDTSKVTDTAYMFYGARTSTATSRAGISAP
ncbi:uncharacterized protein MICPUCDRAFT_60044 [Micromonas pusilla CCMP1545]|uniref:Predicted protein n=1 Tax=Micromonas pusilla (strain CCMP1545) TaxID=564608 RepID=C1MX64_MICPC|nr:uncharacterized protein MICPUCDRAFT_60044 [Micromonas pusilla CCMP1545]EEH55406.1 predicted protein [Micromonas pusilla CCMP1545]|eukprot:XP_003060637.1 predicted protein [Micromonas pusilla CCMP1545]